MVIEINFKVSAHFMVIILVVGLPVEKYRNICDPKKIEVHATNEMKKLEEVIGQDRALRAVKFGLEIKEQGFNVFIAGMPGTGRKTAVGNYVNVLAKTKPKAMDWVYVNNFTNPSEPNAIGLPAGRGKKFADDVDSLIADVRRIVPKIFESDDYNARKEATLKSIEEEKARLFSEINVSAQQQGFIIQSGPMGLLTIPVINGKPLREEEFMALPQQKKEEIQQSREKLNVDLRHAFREMRELDSKGTEAVEKLNRDVAQLSLGPRIQDLREKYSDLHEIDSYMTAVQNDILENLDQFAGEGQQPQLPPQLQFPFLKELPFKKYEVNVIVDNSMVEGAPVIIEQNPSYPNLIGKIEKEVQFGVVSTDFSMIRAGSLHKANGGYMIIPVEDLLRNPFAWDGFKTALKASAVAIEEPGERMGLIATKGIKPEPIPLNFKAILIGTSMIYQLLFSLDPDFKELFKVKADFDITMDRTEENVKKYTAFMCTFCHKYGLKHLDRGAVAKIVEYGSRLAEDQEKLSTRFGSIADVIRESNFYATQEGSEYIMANHVNKTLDEMIYRSNLIQEKVQEYIKRGIFLIETEGAKVGQVNGLSVISLGDFAFGRPSKVTASIGVGRGGIIDIEREASMGGPIHTKGVMILGGYLSNKYAQDKPLGLTAKLVFEQSYEGVEGDSASSTELYAILSALSGLPINQSLAVTGSVNQKGDVQAIGGVNEKIEGFFEICKVKGLNGEQGVMIPASNVQNLMLKEEIIEAAKVGKFRILSISSIDQGIEILTGVKAGDRNADGSFDSGTVNYLVDKRLREMAEKLKEYQAR
jgi:lon-related putative ATP-dependent protease